ncbi:MAG: family transposase, partial [Rhodospirillales bacterium]|nr:family transposase [Rhodospirillales bacterium]
YDGSAQGDRDPTDARLIHKAIIKLVAVAKENGIALRQSYLRVAKRGS